MSNYIKDLRKQAADGIEIAGDGFTAEINIDCRNVIKILDKNTDLESQLATYKAEIEGLKSRKEILQDIIDMASTPEIKTALRIYKDGLSSGMIQSRDDRTKTAHQILIVNLLEALK